MSYIYEKNNYLKIFLGYYIMAMKKLGYSEKSIKIHLDEIDKTIKFGNDAEAIDIIDKFNNDSIKQVVFEGIEIPIEYNIIKINELFEKYGFMGKENNYLGKKICRALHREDIVYVKDLYGKTKEEITHIHDIGKRTYDFFIFAIRQISLKT